jgi:S-adenosylmethionine synthetase
LEDSDVVNRRTLLTSESVTEGHPDKICDQISDAVLDACLGRDPHARVACEASIKSDGPRQWVAVFGETTPSVSAADVDQIVREVLNQIGYTDSRYGACCDEVEIDVVLSTQSGDIAQGVDLALEARGGDEGGDLDTGAGDQGMMFGYACDETPELMPLPIQLAHQLSKNLASARHDNTIAHLRPDGKSQVTVEYENGRPARIATVVVSTQHDPEVDPADLYEEIVERLIRRTIPSGLLDSGTRFFVNPTGRFVVGGPAGDSGLTGRKIIVDTYGGVAHHGGGAFSGKDPTKVDRSAAYAARWVAKTIVAAGLASRCEVQLAYAIGVARPVSVAVETFGTATVPAERIEAAVDEVFDLRPGAIISDLDLRRPIYRPTAAYGHFGRTDLGVTWENTERLEVLRKAATS